ncbi:hypothetical protein ACFWN2_02595 [Lentzea sp. NPDC058436]|uniref:hypothetical protein n=1 Tax=Lentzea sp. NPDC058436 TaxID=3346499 RepID=UPI003653AD0F
MSKSVSFHQISRSAFEAVQHRLLTDLAGERVGDSKDELLCFGVRGSLRYDERSESAVLDITGMPSVLDRATVVSWLQGAFADGDADGIYYDTLRVSLENNASLAVNVSDVPNLTHGKYQTYPISVPANQDGELFKASSRDAAAVGPEGSVTYELPDGTTLNISFDLEYYVGSTSTFTAALGGGPASNYGLRLTDTWDTSPGPKKDWTVQLYLDPNPGATFVQASH